MLEDFKGKYVMIRTRSAGVFCGTLVNFEEQMVKLSNARRIWYWSGAASLSELAMCGTKDPDSCKFPCEVSEIILPDTIEVIPVTKEAEKSIKSVKVWSA